MLSGFEGKEDGVTEEDGSPTRNTLGMGEGAQFGSAAFAAAKRTSICSLPRVHMSFSLSIGREALDFLTDETGSVLYRKAQGVKVVVTNQMQTKTRSRQADLSELCRPPRWHFSMDLGLHDTEAVMQLHLRA